MRIIKVFAISVPTTELTGPFGYVFFHLSDDTSGLKSEYISGEKDNIIMEHLPSDADLLFKEEIDIIWKRGS